MRSTAAANGLVAGASGGRSVMSAAAQAAASARERDRGMGEDCTTPVDSRCTRH